MACIKLKSRSIKHIHALYKAQGTEHMSGIKIIRKWCRMVLSTFPSATFYRFGVQWFFFSSSILGFLKLNKTLLKNLTCKIKTALVKVKWRVQNLCSFY
jgi:hypothetical protein